MVEDPLNETSGSENTLRNRSSGSDKLTKNTQKTIRGEDWSQAQSLREIAPPELTRNPRPSTKYLRKGKALQQQSSPNLPVSGIHEMTAEEEQVNREIDLWVLRQQAALFSGVSHKKVSKNNPLHALDVSKKEVFPSPALERVEASPRHIFQSRAQEKEPVVIETRNRRNITATKLAPLRVIHPRHPIARRRRDSGYGTAEKRIAARIDILDAIEYIDRLQQDGAGMTGNTLISASLPSISRLPTRISH